MATTIRTLIKSYTYLNYEVSDPRTTDWFLIGSPLPIATLLIFYVYFVQTLGPSLMRDRKPFNLDRIMQIYNVAQIFLSGYLFYQALVISWLWDYKLICEPVDFSNNPKSLAMAGIVWSYFMVKVIDLLDTVFFVLRKKNNQVTFLHVYHHTGMVLATWAAVKYLPGGHGTFLGVINSLVHVIMYAYYLAASLKMSRPWWKKYITQLQLVQFFMILLHFLPLIWRTECAFPRWPAIIFVPQNVFMITLFGDFYYKTYVKKPKSQNNISSQNGITKEFNRTIKSE